MRIKGVLLALLVTFSQAETALGHDLEQLEFLRLSLEEQLTAYFDTFRDGHTYISLARFAEYIASSYGPAVIPYLKEYVQGANFFNEHQNPPLESNPKFYEGEPNDMTLGLVALIWRGLHVYAHPSAHDIIQPYTLDSETIQWFVNEYKKRIDEYIAATRMIDETVRLGELYIRYITGARPGPDTSANLRYGHPDFKLLYERHSSRELKEYYERRLGISDLQVDLQVFKE